jgi:hypothetical protein
VLSNRPAIWTILLKRSFSLVTDLSRRMTLVVLLKSVWSRGMKRRSRMYAIIAEMSGFG